MWLAYKPFKSIWAIRKYTFEASLNTRPKMNCGQFSANVETFVKSAWFATTPSSYLSIDWGLRGWRCGPKGCRRYERKIDQRTTRPRLNSWTAKKTKGTPTQRWVQIVRPQGPLVLYYLLRKNDCPDLRRERYMFLNSESGEEGADHRRLHPPPRRPRASKRKSKGGIIQEGEEAQGKIQKTPLLLVLQQLLLLHTLQKGTQKRHQLIFHYQSLDLQPPPLTGLAWLWIPTRLCTPLAIKSGFDLNENWPSMRLDHRCDSDCPDCPSTLSLPSWNCPLDAMHSNDIS